MINKTCVFILMILTSISLSHANSISDSCEIFPKTNRNQLKILTWNIYMLPHCSLVHRNCMRARIIAQKLETSDFDMIVFEEAFDWKARGILFRNLRKSFPYMYGPANKPLLSLRTNSGVWVISKIPLQKVEQIEFVHRFGIDAMARKGAVMFEGEWKGQSFQLICTHLQADSPDSIRRAQCKEISTRLMLKNVKDNVPQIVCGDFNIQLDDFENYQYMLQALDVENGIIEGTIHSSFDEIDNLLARHSNGKKQMIDYILVRNNRVIRNIQRKISVYRALKQNHLIDLSDHYGVEAIFEFSRHNLDVGIIH